MGQETSAKKYLLRDKAAIAADRSEYANILANVPDLGDLK